MSHNFLCEIKNVAAYSRASIRSTIILLITLAVKHRLRTLITLQRFAYFIFILISIALDVPRSVCLMVHKLMKFCFEKTGKSQKTLACPLVLDSNIAALDQLFPLDKVLMRWGWLALSGSHLNGTNVGCFL